jgi:hypothetical protein
MLRDFAPWKSALVSRTVIVNLIGNTKTRAGLQVRVELERYLVALSQREAEAWREVDALIATKQPGKYDDAVKLLKDLRDIAIRAGRQGEVEARLVRLREQHAKKPSLVARLQAAGLIGTTKEGRL